MYATASPFSLFQETRSSFLSIFCLFAYSMSISALYTYIHAHTHFYLQEQQKIYEEGQQFKIKLIHSEVGRMYFSPSLCVIKSQQLSSSFFTLIASFITRAKVLLLRRCSPISRQAQRRRRRRRRRERKKITITITGGERERKNREEKKKGGTLSLSLALFSQHI